MIYTKNPNTKCRCSNDKHHATWDLEPDKILKSITAIFKYQDIDKLTNNAYTFIHNLKGFIAHYDINGFNANYQDLRLFCDDLLKSFDLQNPDYYLTDYFAKDEQSQYYKQKAQLLKDIKTIVLEYSNEINISFTEKEKTNDLILAKSILDKYNLKIT